MAERDFLREPCRALYRPSSLFETEGRTLVKALVKSLMLTFGGETVTGTCSSPYSGFSWAFAAASSSLLTRALSVPI